LVCGGLSLTGYVNDFVGMVGYVTSALLLLLYVTSLIKSSLNRSNRSVFCEADVFGLLLLAVVSSSIGLGFTCDCLARYDAPIGNIFLLGYASATHSVHWIWSIRLLSVTVFCSLCLAVKPLQKGVSSQSDSHQWRKMLWNTGGLGPLIFLALGYIVSVSSSLAFFLCYIRVLAFEEPSRRKQVPTMPLRARQCAEMISYLIIFIGFLSIVYLNYSKPNRTAHLCIVGLTHTAICLPGLWWSSSYSEFEPSKSPADHLSTWVVWLVLGLSGLTDFCALSGAPDMVALWSDEVNSLQIRVALDNAFVVVALMLWQRNILRMVAVLTFPGTTLAMNALYPC